MTNKNNASCLKVLNEATSKVQDIHRILDTAVEKGIEIEPMRLITACMGGLLATFDKDLKLEMLGCLTKRAEKE